LASNLGDHGSSDRLTSEINVTPLVDVVLVLLIIFMVITPLLHRGKSVELPEAANIETDTATEPIVLSVTEDGRLWVDADEIAGLAEAERLIAGELAKRPDRVILLKGDRGLEVGAVRELMRAARRAGARGVSLAVAEPAEGARR
jgi:biopolymer transport protein TolR